LLGVTIVPVALYIRRTLPETIHQADTAVVDDSEGLRSYLRPVVCGLLIIGSGTIATYIFNYMATFGQNTLGLSSTLSLMGEFANNGIGIIALMIGGVVSDRIGRKPMLVWPQLSFTILIVPCFLWLTTARDTTSFIGANLILSFVYGLWGGAGYAAISESIPKAVRARAFALVYAIPVTFLGGTTQLVVTWILQATNSPMAIAWYLTVVSIIGLGAMFALKESAPVKLQQASF